MVSFDLSAQQILLVDDVAFSRETIRRVLRAMGEPQIIDAANGVDAIEHLSRARGISMVIADFNMPVFNGLQLLQAIRLGQTAASRALPVAMLTGHSDQHLVTSALALDVNAFAIKPVSANTLGQRLVSMLRQADDVGWLKSPEDYEAVEVPGRPRPKPKAPAKQRTAIEPEESKTLDESRRSARLKRPAGSAGKLQEAERLAGEIANRLIKADTSDAPSASDETMTRGVQNIIVDSGTEVARSVLATLEDMLVSGHLSSNDVARSLEQDSTRKGAAASQISLKDGAETLVDKIEDVPVGAILSGDVMTMDGKTIAQDGTPLTPQLLSTIGQLQLIGVLLPQSKEGVSIGKSELAYRFGDAKSMDGQPMTLVQPQDVASGTVLANDIFLNDGRPYMLSGSQLTDRSVTLLQDLRELERVDSGVWIKQ